MSRINNETISGTSKEMNNTIEKNVENLTNVSPFLIKKVIDCACGSEVEMCKKIRDGNILIKTKNNLQAAKLITLTSLSPSIQVEVREHTTLNFSKGVIYSNDLRGIEEEEILHELKNQNVTEIRKILKKVGKELIETGLIIITLATLNLPENLKIGYEKVKVRPYIPYPLRCRKCLRYGHTKNTCVNNAICPNCALSYHFEEDDEKCNNPSTCVNCVYNNNANSQHSSLDKNCPIFLREKEIQSIVTLEKVDRKKAVETYKQRHQSGQSSYSTVTKTATTNKQVFFSTSNNNPTTLSNTIRESSNLTNVNNSTTLCTTTREPVNYNNIETPTCSNIESTINSAKQKLVNILPKNTSNRSIQLNASMKVLARLKNNWNLNK
ncbi:asparagine-rich protein-like [Calliphora vicina]|uniref:asparagine-rich protein-like n=1 Tax=Calliphora vicina TaxID=7373 RepID=UPI00325A6C59